MATPAPNPNWLINTDITRGKKLEAQFLRAAAMETRGAAGGIAP